MTRVTMPVLISGPGRSGTTLLLHVLSRHPDAAWFSGWTDRFPDRPFLALLSRVNDVDPVERATRDVRRWPRPAEAYGIWNHYFPGFSTAQSDWTAREVDRGDPEAFLAFVEAHLRWQGKSRFLTKYTGWPRFDFLRRLFPDAHLVSIDRDPRAVVASYMKQRWGYKDKPREYEGLPPDQRVAIQVERYLSYYDARKRHAEGRDYVGVQYEHLVADLVGTVREICRRVDLPFTARFERRLRTFEIHGDSNEAWKKNLSREEQHLLSKLLQKPLDEMGYAA